MASVALIVLSFEKVNVKEAVVSTIHFASVFCKPVIRSFEVNSSIRFPSAPGAVPVILQVCAGSRTGSKSIMLSRMILDAGCWMLDNGSNFMNFMNFINYLPVRA
jgi:hypothetical protein